MKIFSKYIIVFICLFCNEAIGQNTQIDSLYALADKAFQEADYPAVIQHNLRALSLAEKTGICTLEINAHFRTAAAYYHLKKREDTRFHLDRGFERAKECNSVYLQARACRLIGSVKCEDRDIDSALYFLKHAESLLAGSEKWAELSLLNSIMGEVYFESTHEKHNALKHFLLAEEYAAKTNDVNTRAFALMKSGRYNVYKKQYKEAERYFKKALDLYRSIQSTEGEIYALTELALSKSQELNSKEVYDLMKIAGEKRDSIFKKETADKLADYHAIYETEKKETELKQQKEKTAFYLLIAALVILSIIIVFILYYRNNQNRQKLNLLETKEKERSRIARDLHDNLGSNVSYIISKTQKMLEDNRSFQEEGDLMQVKDSASQIMSTLRETIWALHKTAILNTELADKIKQYISKNLLAESDISEKIVREATMPVDAAMAIYRCVQEIINNINRHSKAGIVRIAIDATETRIFTIRINDNGIGFEHTEKEGSYGLRNMKERIKEINAEISIIATRDTGTEIYIAL